MTDNIEGMASVENAAKLLSISKSTVYSWIKNPELQPNFPVPVKMGSKIAIPKKELNDYLVWLLNQRAQAPLTDHTGKKNDTSHLTPEELLQRRLNKPEGWTPEQSKHDPVWDSIGSNSDDQ